MLAFTVWEGGPAQAVLRTDRDSWYGSQKGQEAWDPRSQFVEGQAGTGLLPASSYHCVDGIHRWPALQAERLTQVHRLSHC